MGKGNRSRRGRITLWSGYSSTVISITLVLLLFGILLLSGYHFYQATHEVQERITLKVDLNPEISDSLALAIKEDIANLDYVKHVDYISKEEAAHLFSDELGEDFIGFIGYNPLYPSIMVNFRSEIIPDKEHHLLQQFTQTITKNEQVTGVSYQESVVKELTNSMYNLIWLVAIFLVLHLFVTVILINNTIKLSITLQRDTIQTMRMVGAKNSFIARPFVWRSMLYGLIGAILALILIAVGMNIIDRSMGLQLVNARYTLHYGLIAAAVCLAGIMISSLATIIAVRHALHLAND